jgi:hypothetical protein
MKKTVEQKRIEYLERENSFLYLIKSLNWSYDYYINNYIKFLEKDDAENAKNFKIKANTFKSKIDFYGRKLNRFKNLYNKQHQKYANNFGNNKKIIKEIIKDFPEKILHYDKRNDLKHRFLKKDKKNYTSHSTVWQVFTKDKDEKLLLQISANSNYLNFKFYYDIENKYNLDSNLLEFIINILKINNKVIYPAYGNSKHPYSKDTLEILRNNSKCISFFAMDVKDINNYKIPPEKIK